MSDFYKEKRNKILKSYKFFGIVEKFMILVSKIALTLLVYLLVVFLLGIDLNNLNFKFVIAIVIILGMGILVYGYSRIYKRDDFRMRNNTLKSFLADPEMNERNLKSLIKEIERSINRSKTFSAWVAGMFSTIIILVATLTTNLSFKVWDERHNVFTKEEMKDIAKFLVEMIKHGNDDLVSMMLNFASSIFFILVSVVFGIYLIFSMTTFIQKQMLVFLYDVQYEMDKDKTEEPVE